MPMRVNIREAVQVSSLKGHQKPRGSTLFVFNAEGAIQDSLGQAKGRCRPVAQP